MLKKLKSILLAIFLLVLFGALSLIILYAELRFPPAIVTPIKLLFLISILILFLSYKIYNLNILFSMPEFLLLFLISLTFMIYILILIDYFHINYINNTLYKMYLVSFLITSIVFIILKITSKKISRKSIIYLFLIPIFIIPCISSVNASYNVVNLSSAQANITSKKKVPHSKGQTTYEICIDNADDLNISKEFDCSSSYYSYINKGDSVKIIYKQGLLGFTWAEIDFQLDRYPPKCTMYNDR